MATAAVMDHVILETGMKAGLRMWNRSQTWWDGPLESRDVTARREVGTRRCGLQTAAAKGSPGRSQLLSHGDPMAASWPLNRDSGQIPEAPVSPSKAGSCRWHGQGWPASNERAYSSSGEVSAPF